MSEPGMQLLELERNGGWRLDGVPWEADSEFYAVLGDPIAHSRSPSIQNAALREREFAAVYLAVRAPAGRLAALRRRGAASGLIGFNVTAPLKEEAAGLCAGRTDVARELGAVNTIKVEDERWLGHNTDSGGIMAVLTELRHGRAAPDSATVLGAGGSARSAVHALDRWGVDRIEIRNRSSDGRRRIESWLARDPWPRRARINVAPLTGSDASAPAAVTVVALAGGVDPTPYLPPVDASDDAGSIVLDLRYGDQRPDYEVPPSTTLVDGLPILLMQGGLAFAWWFGTPVPWQAMRRALED